MLMLVSCGSQKSPEMQVLERKQQILELNTEINTLKIKLLEKENEQKNLSVQVKDLAAKASERFDDFANSDRVSSRRTRNALKDVEKANKDLAKVNKEIKKINRQISKRQKKLSAFEKKIKFVEKNQAK